MINRTNVSFINLGLSNKILSALNDLGYKKPSLIQKKCIPYLLNGHDVLGIAQTGSGKTAAFSLPLINNINHSLNKIQILILVPTRELAIQVTESIKNFSKNINYIRVISIYGGQSYQKQIKYLKQNPKILVGTPGRLLDHIKRKTINLSYLTSLVLDEADKMLKMGFIEDVQNIMSKIPNKYQIALFSATMPKKIKNITRRFMKSPKEINIQFNKIESPKIEQNYCIIHGIKKNEALIRFLEIENFKSVIVFVRTKNKTLEISKELEKNGYNSSPLNGDMNQSLREKTLNYFKNGNFNILIATDIAARGLDVKRINLVINYDIPIDIESYIHRIGRTGRAGGNGKAILFVNYYEKKLLNNIKKNTKNKITKIELPDLKILQEKRKEKIFNNIKKQIQYGNLEKYKQTLNELIYKENLNIEKIALALFKINSEKKLFFFENKKKKKEYQSKFKIKKNKIKFYKIKKKYTI